MTIFTEMNKLNEHFFKESDKFVKKQKEQDIKQEYMSVFKTYNVGGKQVIDLTSIDREYNPVQLLRDDIERQQIYGDKAGNPNLL